MVGKTEVAPKIEFTTFVPEEKVNPYTTTVAKLAEAGEDAAVVITVDANKASAEQFKFQKAANAIGKTARVRHVDDSGAEVTGVKDNGKKIYKGDVKITFTLTTKHKARRGNDK